MKVQYAKQVSDGLHNLDVGMYVKQSYWSDLTFKTPHLIRQVVGLMVSCLLGTVHIRLIQWYSLVKVKYSNVPCTNSCLKGCKKPWCLAVMKARFMSCSWCSVELLLASVYPRVIYSRGEGIWAALLNEGAALRRGSGLRISFSFAFIAPSWTDIPFQLVECEP